MSDIYLDLKPSRSFTNAEDFYRCLSPTGDILRNEEPNSPWLFRGLADSSYRLVPSAFHPHWPLGQFTSSAPTRPVHYPDQIAAEVEVLHTFFNLVDQNSLVLPEDSQDLRAMMRGLVATYGSRNKVHDWLWQDYKKLYSVIALAQHYGIPTRFLDWSRNPLTAAYFAANPLLKMVDEHDRQVKLITDYCASCNVKVDAFALAKSVKNLPQTLSVWAFKFPRLDDISAPEAQDFPFVVVTSPAATNAHLSAQEGVFTLIRHKAGTKIDQYLQNSRPRMRTAQEIPFDTYLNEVSEPSVQNDPKSVVTLQEFTLPTSEAPKLLWLLGKSGKATSNLMPGLDGCVKQVEERLKWQIC